ncbi:MAG: hypothetical protein J6V36_04195, partial [Clostridia bacterium]|nr:hypothetical protein [Clostridia bacterium]
MKCKYYSSSKSFRDIGGMLKYIATREGVDQIDDGWKTEPASKLQEDIIMKLCEKHKDCKQLQEYISYSKYKTKGSASEFISAVLENYPHLLSDKTYLDYIATRPRVERIEGKHGLFSSDGVAIDLEKEAENIRNHEGNIFTIIVSLKRHDAERVGYNYAERWRTLVQSRIEDIAKEYKIPAEKLKWFGAFHNEAHHPHIHLMLYSTDKFDKGFITKRGIDNLRHLFGTEIFSDDIDNYYKEQTEYRNTLNSNARDEIISLADKIKKGLIKNDEFVLKFISLAKRLHTVKGKKVYGYLPKNVKEMVCELVDILEKDKNIERAYELWYQAKCAVYSTYTDNPPPKKPLSQEEVFKPIRNAIIKEADELGKLLELNNAKKTSSQNTVQNNNTNASSQKGYNTTSNSKTNSNSNANNSTNTNTNSNSNPNPNDNTNNSNNANNQNNKQTFSKTQNAYIASSVTRLG